VGVITSSLCKPQTHPGLCQAILRLRLFCNHGLSMQQNRYAFHYVDEQFSFLQQNSQTSCENCYEQLESLNDGQEPRSGIYTNCLHLVCFGRLNQDNGHTNNKGRNGKLNCPICGDCIDEGVTECDNSTSSSSLNTQEQYQSTKLTAVLNDMRIHQGGSKRYVIGLLAHHFQTNI